jgi:Condensation domain
VTDRRAGWFQERRVLLDRLARAQGQRRADNITIAHRITGEVDDAVLAEAAGHVAARHEPLRTVFPSDADPPVARVLRPTRVPIEHVDAASEAEAVRTVASGWLDIQTGPVLRIVRAFCPGSQLLVVCYPHIVGDGVESVNVFIEELAECYRALLAGERPNLPALSCDYGEFAQRHRAALTGDVLRSLLDWWRERLPPNTPDPPANLPTLTLGSGTALGAAASVRVSGDDVLVRHLPSLRSRYRTTDFTLFLAGLLAAVRLLADQESVGALFAVDVRSRYRASGLIGSFATLSVVWLPLAEDATLADVVLAVRARVIEVARHGDLPFEEIIRELYPEWWEDIESPPYVFFSAGSARPRPWETSSLSAQPVRPDVAPRHLHPGLKVVLSASREAIELSCQYAVLAFAPEVVRALLETAMAMVGRLVDRPDTTLAELRPAPVP